MCFALLKIEYTNNTEPAAVIPVELQEDLEKKIEEVRGRPAVNKITIYRRWTTHKQVTIWESQEHD